MTELNWKGENSRANAELVQAIIRADGRGRVRLLTDDGKPTYIAHRLAASLAAAPPNLRIDAEQKALLDRAAAFVSQDGVILDLAEALRAAPLIRMLSKQHASAESENDSAQSTPKGPATQLNQEIADLIWEHTGISRQQFPEEYAELHALAQAAMALAPQRQAAP